MIDNAVSIRTAESERVDARAANLALGPRHSRVLHNMHLGGVKVDMRVQLFYPACRRDLARLKRQDDLHDGRECAGSLRVAQVGLDRPDQQAVLGRIRLPGRREDVAHGGHLEGVASRGSCAVALKEGCVLQWQIAGVLKRLPDGVLLTLGAGPRDAPRLAVGIDARATDHGPDGCAFQQGQVGFLEVDCGEAFASGIPVRCGVECVAAGCRRQGTQLVQHDLHTRVLDPVCGCHDGAVAVPAAYGAHSEVEGVHGR